MDFRTPCQIALGLLLAAFALSVLGLAADNISYVEDHSNGEQLQIHYMRWNETAQKPYSYWLKMDYLPSKFSLGTTHAMLGASIVCFLVGTGIAVGSWIMRKEKSLKTSFSLKNRSMPFLPVALILTTITFVVTLGLSAYTFKSVMRFPVNLPKSLPLPPQYHDMNSRSSLIYQSPFPYTPEVWNCFLSNYVVNPAQSNKLHNLCHEAKVGKYLMIPMLLVSAALSACLLWTWQKARVTGSSEVEMSAKEIDEVSVTSRN